MTATKKYKLTDIQNEKGLFRIRALRDFGSVKSGDLGGWVESEDNLSHEGDCWVSGESQVSNNTWVRDNALVYGNVLVYGNAWVTDDAQVFGNA